MWHRSLLQPPHHGWREAQDPWHEETAEHRVATDTLPCKAKHLPMQGCRRIAGLDNGRVTVKLTTGWTAVLRFLSRKRLASRLPAYAGEARNDDRSALALLDGQPKSSLNTQQMQRVIQCMTNKVATLGTVVKQCFGMVIRGKKMGQDQAGICVCVGWGSWPHHGARLAFLSKYQHTMHG